MYFKIGFNLNLLHLIANDTYLSYFHLIILKSFKWYCQGFDKSINVVTCFIKSIVITITKNFNIIQNKKNITKKYDEKNGF